MHKYKKLLAAGFRIFRLRELDKSIWENISGKAWSLYGKDNTGEEAKREFNQLLKNNKFIEE